MAESDGQEKTEEPTQRKLEKSREKGQVARSKESASAVLLLTSSALFILFGGKLAEACIAMLRFNLSLTREQVFDQKLMLNHLSATAIELVQTLLPILAILALSAIIAQLVPGGWLFSAQSLAPQLKRMSPTQWFSKVFSVRGLVELLKSLLKVTLVMGCLGILLYLYYPRLLSLGSIPLPSSIFLGVEVLAVALLAYGLVLGLIAAVDIPFQFWDHRKQLMMTKQEVKEEHKNMEGKPEVKSKIRQLQHEMANRRMMQEVPQADVVITNPTHYSVAVKYDESRASAPFVVAKGVDDIALKIREVARVHEVTIMEAPVLARAIYHSTRLEQEIPADLYMAVAQLLAYVHQLEAYYQGKVEEEPARPEFDVPSHHIKPAG
ncbi:flagellar biosynthesis protein FlhB [Spongorhabdus nitratireducens]